MNPRFVSPRFVWNLGSLAEVFPDLPPQTSDVVLWDRQERQPVLTLHARYAQALCLETTRQPGDAPFTSLEHWWNHLPNDVLASEGLPPTQPTPP